MSKELQDLTLEIGINQMIDIGWSVNVKIATNSGRKNNNMPYIIQADRKQYNSAIEDLLDAISNHGFSPVKPGDLNYVISKMVWEIFDKNPSYTKGNELVGVLECVKQEFLRRRLNGYEDEKIKENGDL